MQSVGIGRLDRPIVGFSQPVDHQTRYVVRYLDSQAYAAYKDLGGHQGLVSCCNA